MATATTTLGQDALLEATRALPAELHSVSSAGRWRTADAEGVYRVVVYRGGYERVVDRLYIQWVRDESDERPAEVVAAVGVSQINDTGPYTVSLTLRAVSTNQLQITVDSLHGYTRQRRRFVLLAAAPLTYTEARVPSSARPSSLAK